MAARILAYGEMRIGRDSGLFWRRRLWRVALPSGSSPKGKSSVNVTLLLRSHEPVSDQQKFLKGEKGKRRLGCAGYRRRK